VPGVRAKAEVRTDTNVVGAAEQLRDVVDVIEEIRQVRPARHAFGKQQGTPVHDAGDGHHRQRGVTVELGAQQRQPLSGYCQPGFRPALLPSRHGLTSSARENLRNAHNQQGA